MLSSVRLFASRQALRSLTMSQCNLKTAVIPANPVPPTATHTSAVDLHIRCHLLLGLSPKSLEVNANPGD